MTTLKKDANGNKLQRKAQNRLKSLICSKWEEIVSKITKLSSDGISKKSTPMIMDRF